MANQWGRDSGFQPGSRRGSGALTVIAVVFALAIGAAGGYAASYYSQPDATRALNAAGTKTAELETALATTQDNLSQARAAQASSAAQVEELKADIARMASDLDAMTQRLAEGASSTQSPDTGNAALEAISRERDGLAAENQTLNESLKALEAERDALAETASAASKRLEAEISRLQTDVVPQLIADRNGLQRKITMMLADQATLKSRIKAASDASKSDAAVMADLQARLADVEGKLRASEASLATALEVAKSETPEVKDTATAADSQQSDPAANSVGQADPASSPRDPDAVAAALRAAPGLETLSDANRRALSDRLIAGECVTTALESVFDRIPILTLRNLIRDLNSDC